MANNRNAPQCCYICDVELLPIASGHAGSLRDNHSTRDHVPPDGLFCDPKPSDLITVPCCHKHNRKHSGADERLRMLAALEIGRNQGGEKILRDKVFGSTFKKLRQREFVTRIATTMRNEVTMTPQGPMPVAVFSVDGKELLDCMADITRGLLKNFYPQLDYHGHDFMVIDIHSATLAKGQRDAQLHLIREMVAKTVGDFRGSQHEFRFWRQVDEQREHGAWLLVFYETLAFTVCHSRIPFKTLFDAKEKRNPLS
jgi:hypothetical protein